MTDDRTDPTPVALYARVSSDRQDVDLSVAAQLRALRDYAGKNGYVVTREYVDEAESGRVADRPEFRRMLDEASGQDLCETIPTGHEHGKIVTKLVIRLGNFVEQRALGTLVASDSGVWLERDPDQFAAHALAVEPEQVGGGQQLRPGRRRGRHRSRSRASPSYRIPPRAGVCSPPQRRRRPHDPAPRPVAGGSGVLHHLTPPSVEGGIALLHLRGEWNPCSLSLGRESPGSRLQGPASACYRCWLLPSSSAWR